MVIHARIGESTHTIPGPIKLKTTMEIEQMVSVTTISVAIQMEKVVGFGVTPQTPTKDGLIAIHLHLRRKSIQIKDVLILSPQSQKRCVTIRDVKARQKVVIPAKTGDQIAPTKGMM